MPQTIIDTVYTLKNADKMSERELRNEVKTLRKGLQRLASPEAFVMSRMTNEEERARMEYAEHVLKSVSQSV